MEFKLKLVFAEMGDEYVAVPVGSDAEHFVVRLNKTGRDICEDLAKGMNEAEIVEKLVNQYEDVNREKAEQAVKSVISKLQAEGLLE